MGLPVEGFHLNGSPTLRANLASELNTANRHPGFIPFAYPRVNGANLVGAAKAEPLLTGFDPAVRHPWAVGLTEEPDGNLRERGETP